ncbi:ABC transporter permease subunit [Agromyces aerolatus]|uniref:ABC transporter permease subunit n=1 Tax=Agromyces sp. LY-1074 TaxID=3074080 RepID=UPI002864F890|nr:MULTISPECIES: ABC transporter permease subunit [unclassified Agromyces]MDR5699886.1 ABC transporter permease subunit [Agromyces sp. LY-1074]MDR5706302.1 ABC transporter permease subunit [Agromyces sp. LY-1358]
MTTTLPQPTAASRTAPESSLSFAGVLRSEWIKLRSLRSTVWSYAIVIVIALGMALIMSLSLVNGMGGVNRGGDLAAMPVEQQVALVVQSTTFGVLFGQLVAGVLGVLVITGEYSTGMIRSTLTAVPRRTPALAAKAVVLFVSTFVVGLVATLGAYGVTSIVVAGSGVSVSLLEPAIFLPVLGAALYLALVAVFALAIGTIVRSSAGGIAAVLGLILLLPTVLQMIPAEWPGEVIPYLIGSAGTGIFMSATAWPAGDELGAWVSLFVVLGWVVAAMAGALALLKRRDA